MSTSGPTNPTQALLAALNGFHAAGDRVALLPELERLAREADALDEVAEAVETASESVESAPTLCALLRFAARLREELGQAPQAMVLWNDLLAAQPVDVEALDALARLFAQAQDFAHAAEVTLRRARLQNPGPERHAHFVAAADFFVRAHAPDAALEALEESLSRPLVAEALSAIGAVHVRRGKLLETRRPPDAVASYAVAINVPELAETATAGLRRLLGVSSARAAAASALEPVVRRRNDPYELVELLQARADATPELALLLEIAKLREQTGEPRLALATYVRAFALAPNEPDLRAALERLATALDAPDELLAAYEEQLHREPNRADAGLVRRVAELHDELGNRDQALEAWEWAAEIAPADHALLAAWAERCRKRGDLSLLAKVLRRQVAAKPDEATRLKLLTALARLCEELADDVGASHAYQDLSDAAPGDRQLLKTLERLYEQTGNAVGLGAALERDLALSRDAPVAERVALSLRLARLKLAPPEDDARALELLREVLRLAPGNAQAVAALAQLASTPGPVQATATELVTPALDALGDYPGVVQILEAQLASQAGSRERVATLRRIAELYAGPLEDADLAFLAITRALREAPHDGSLLQRALELGNAAQSAEDLDALLGELAGAQPPGEARLALFRTLAKRHDARGTDARDEAVAAWSEVLAQAPNDAEAQARLEDLFAQNGRLSDLAVLWRQRVDAAPPADRPALLLRLAAVQERGGDPDAAASTLLTLFAMTRSAETLVPLERVLGASGRHLERAEALLRLAELARQAGNDKEALDRLVQQARALTAAGEPGRAVQVYADVLRLVPSEPRAVTDLVALAADARVSEAAAELLASVFTAPEQRTQRAAVLEVLASNAELAAGPAFRAELASLHEQLGDVTQAFVGWVRLVRDRPDDDAARAQLERVALAGHLEEELVATYEELLERTPPLPRALLTQLQATTARLYAGPLQSPDAAVRAWESLARADRDAVEPLTALEPLYRQRADWVRLGEVLERQAALLTGPARVDSLRRLAQLADGPLKNTALAIDALRKLLEQSPDDVPAVRELARLYAGTSRQAEAAQMLERLVTLLDAEAAPGEVADLALQVGRLQLELQQPARAVESFARALRLRPDEVATASVEALLGAELAVRARAAEALEPVYRARQDQARLASALGLQLSVAGPERKVVLLEELCALRESLGELPLAFLARQELYTRQPQQAGAAAELQRLAEATGSLEELVETFTARLEQSPGDEEALDLWRRVARTKQQRGDRDGAAKAWEQVARRAPAELAPLETLSELYLASNRYAELPRVLTLRAELEPSVPRQVELLLQVADVAETHLEDLVTAIEAGRAVRARGDDRAYPLLERLYERSGRHDEARALLLEQLKAAAGKEALGLALRVRLARLEHRSRNDDRAALELLDAVRQAQPAHPDAIAVLEEMMRSGRRTAAQAAAALESHYQREGLSARQVEALEVRAAAEGRERSALLHRVADLHERALASPSDAFDVLARLLREQPDDAHALERVAALAGPANGEARLAALLTEVAARASETRRPAVLRELAGVRERLGDAPAALEAWLALIALRPDEVPALERASVLLQGAGRWKELDEVLQRRYELAANDEDRVATLVRLAELSEGPLNQPAAAFDTWRRVLELRPDDPLALQRLDALCVRLERWAELAEVLGRRLRVGSPDRSELVLRLARVRREKLENAAAALPLLGELLADATHAGARAELEQLVQAQPGWEPAADLLLGTYRRARDVEKLAAWLETCANEALPGPKRRALWVELADLQLEQLGNAERAFQAMARAFREAPTEVAVREKLVTLATAASAFTELAAVFDEVLPRLEQPHAAEVSLALALVCEQHLGKPQRAVELYRAASKVPRLTERALAGLDRTLTTLAAWAQLLPVLEERERAAEEGPERVALLLRIAEVAGEKLDQAERSAEAYRAVLEREPKHVEAAQALEHLYERTGQVDRLVDILERLLGLLSGAAQRGVRLKLARLYATRDPERCIALCQQLLRDDPLHAEAFAMLSERFEAERRWNELEKLFQATLLVTLVPQDAADLAFRLAELTYRQLGRPKDAVARYRAVLDRSPGHVPSLEVLRELHEAANDRPALSAVLAELVASHADKSRRREHLVRRTEVLAELKEREPAVGAARQALALEEGEPSELEPLLRRLRPVLLALNALPEAAQVLERLAKLEAEAGRTAEAVATLLELAQVDVRRANSNGACAALERALRLDPTQRAAWEQLDALYTKASAWAPWASLAERFVVNLDGEERLAVLDQLAAVHGTQLGDRRAAFDWATRAVRLDPGSAERRRTAEQLGGALKALPALAAAYAETLAALPFGPAYVGLALALAALQDEKLNQLEAAEKTLGELLAHDPSHAGALDALVQMYERRGLHERRAKALEQKLEFTADAATRKQLLLTLAELHETWLKQPGPAAYALRRLLELEPSVANARLLVALHRRHQAWSDVLDALLQVRGLSARDQRAAVQLEIAALHERELKDLDTAIAAYQEALELDAKSSEAFRGLERLYLQLDRRGELLHAYERRLAQKLADEEAIELHFKLAALWEERGNPLNADQALVAVLKLDASQLRALEGLARLRRAMARWRPLTETLARTVLVVTEPAKLAALCTEAGQVHLEHLREPAAAERWWNQALAHVAEHRPALEALVELQLTHARWQDGLKYLARLVQLERDPSARAALEFRAGAVHEERLKDLPAARAAWQRALKSDPVHLPSLRRLRALFRQAGEWREYEANLAQEATHAPSPVDRCAAAVELAAHLEKRAGHEVDAVPWYEHALAARPEALEAALPLCDLLIFAERWPRAAEVLKRAVSLLEHEAKQRPAERINRLCQLARAQRELDQPQLALETYAHALQLDSVNAAALRGQVDVLVQLGQLEEATRKLELFDERHGLSLPRAQRAATRLERAQLQWQLGRAREAQALAESTLEIEPTHADALRLLIAACDALSGFDRAATARQRLAVLVTGDERLRLLLEQGVLLREKLASPTRAVDVFLEALKTNPSSRSALRELFTTYKVVGHNRKAAEYLEKLVEHPEQSAEERRRDTLVLADLVGRQIGDVDRAADLLGRALDQTPDFAEALEALEALLTRAKAWKRLAAAYEQLIRRLGDGVDSVAARRSLWSRLGELRLRHLEDRLGALRAFEGAATLAPSDPATQEAFADLALAAFPERTADAVQAYLRALPHGGSLEKLCAAVAALAEREKDLDTGWLAARAAEVTGTVNARHKALLDRVAAHVVMPPPFLAPVSDQAWRERLLHPLARGPLADVMATLAEPWLRKYSTGLSGRDVHPKKHAIDLRTVTHPALVDLLRVARELGFEAVDLYSPFLAPQTSSRRQAHPADRVGVHVMPTFPPSVLVGEELIADRDRVGLHAVCGASLAALRPELVLALQTPAEALELLFEAALSLDDPNYASRTDAKVLKVERKRLEKALSSQGREALRATVARYVRTAKKGDFARYLEGATKTPLRAALLVCGDLAAARRRLVPAGDKGERALRELLDFSLGGDLHALRQETGSALVAR